MTPEGGRGGRGRARSTLVLKRPCLPALFFTLSLPIILNQQGCLQPLAPENSGGASQGPGEGAAARSGRRGRPHAVSTRARSGQGPCRGPPEAAEKHGLLEDFHKSLQGAAGSSPAVTRGSIKAGVPPNCPLPPRARGLPSNIRSYLSAVTFFWQKLTRREAPNASAFFGPPPDKPTVSIPAISTG